MVLATASIGQGCGPPSAPTTSAEHAGKVGGQDPPAVAALLDTVRLSGPVGDITGLDDLAQIRQSRVILDQVTGVVDEWPYWFSNGLRLLTYRDKGTLSLVVEASLPKRATGTNLHLLPLHEAAEQVRSIHAWLSQHVEWRCDWRSLKVHRLDVSLDFTAVTALPYLLPAFAAMPVRWERTAPAVWSDPERGHAQTLTRGSRHGVRVSLYDKHSEVVYNLRRQHGRAATASHPLVLAARGVARFEAQCRQKYLADFDVHHWSDITEARLCQMRRQAFQRHHFHRPVVSGLELDRAMRADGMSEARRGGLFYYAHLLSTGQPSEADRGTKAQRRRDLERLGLVPGDLLRPAPRVWLDYDSQRQRDDAHLN